MTELENAVVLAEAKILVKLAVGYPVRTSAPLMKRSLAGSAETVCPSIKTAAEPGAIAVLSRMYSAGLTIDCADAMMMVSSWARTTLAMDITMRANFTNERKIESILKNEMG